MAYRGKGIRGGRGRAFMVNNDDGIDNFGNQNHFRNEIEELSIQIATLNDKVQLLLLKRRLATLIKKVHRLLPHEGIYDSHSQAKFSIDYKEENIGDGLKESYGPFNPDKFEGEMNLTPDVFEEVQELGHFNGFPIFDEYPSEELESALKDDVIFGVEREFEDLPIFDESPNEGFGGDLEGILVYDEYPCEYKDIDDDVLPKFDECPHEEFEDDSIFETSREFEDVPTYDKEFRVGDKKERFVDMIKENFPITRQESKEAQEEEKGVNVLSNPKEVTFDVSLVLEDFVELKLDSRFHEMPLELSLVQDVQVCDVVVPGQVPKLPKKGVDYLVLEDPLGIVFTQASLGYEVNLDFLHIMLDDS